MARDWLVRGTHRTPSWVAAAKGFRFGGGWLVSCQGRAASHPSSHGQQSISSVPFLAVHLIFALLLGSYPAEPPQRCSILLAGGWGSGGGLGKQPLPPPCPFTEAWACAPIFLCPPPSWLGPSPAPPNLALLPPASAPPNLTLPACPALLGERLGAPGQRDYWGIRAAAGSHLLPIGWKSLLKVEKCFLPAQHPPVSADLKP